MEKTKFDWKIFGKKAAKEIIFIFAAGLAAYYGDNALYLALAPVLKMGLNAVKHY